MQLKLIVIWVGISLLYLGKVAQSEDLRSSSYVRYESQGQIYYGVLSGQLITRLEGGLFPLSELLDDTVTLKDVVLLPPTDPAKVFAVGMNFASHMSSAANAPPPLFLKLPSSLIGHNQDVLVPIDAQNVHFEGELVVVIGKKAKNVTEEKAGEYIFGITAGNDLTERSWQGSDLQWMRAKASDGFGPVGPAIVTGLDWNKLLLTTRLNGKVVQQETTAHMIHKPEKVVSYLSHYFTLEPGDMIFMGTPGRTSALVSGDEISVEIEGVGVLRNVIKWP
ncbi:fumarylacetoacetate hydrolase family protein [Kiloniella majae]|uniref:fumarylacetoacetate hydrolase family protein n=1 Tax=Kiloniella majae TaxID=1938558 RepID=UPI000A278E6C|nr:fumarylacetoacetate hydrolase family protein [Kiloniella majae]